MKKIIFLVAMFVGFSAIAQQETLKMEQEIPVKLLSVVVTDNAHVNIFQSDKNVVRIASTEVDSANVNIKDVVTLTGACLNVGTNQNVEIYVSGLTSLDIFASGAADVIFSTENKVDTIVIDNLNIIARDNASIIVESPVKNSTIKISNKDAAMVKFINNVVAQTLDYNNEDSGNLFIKDIISAKGPCGGNYIDFNGTGCHPYIEKPEGFYSAAQRFNLGFYFGWNNWGDAPMNGFVSLPGAYEANTTLSALNFELSYSLICRPHFASGIGIGIGRNKMKLTNPLVQYDENGKGLVIADENSESNIGNLNNWTSDYFLRQVSLPIHFTYYASSKHFSSFTTSITVIPMLHFATKKAGLNNHYEDMSGQQVNLHESNTNNPLKAFNCDIRLSVGYSWLNVYVQTSLLPVFDKAKMNNTKIYPVSIGLGVSF